MSLDLLEQRRQWGLDRPLSRPPLLPVVDCCATWGADCTGAPACVGPATCGGRTAPGEPVNAAAGAGPAGSGRQQRPTTLAEAVAVPSSSAWLLDLARRVPQGVQLKGVVNGRQLSLRGWRLIPMASSTSMPCSWFAAPPVAAQQRTAPQAERQPVATHKAPFASSRSSFS